MKENENIPGSIDWITLEQAAKSSGPDGKLARLVLERQEKKIGKSGANTAVPSEDSQKTSTKIDTSESSQTHPTTDLIKLPVWPNAVRAVPNAALRSALFGAIGKGRRRYIKGEYMATVEGMEIFYRGERLDQGDLDVWENVLHLVRHQPIGTQCRFTSYALLKLMGKTDSGKNRATLLTRIERLRANAVTIKNGRYTYIGGLIASAAKDENSQEWVIELDAKLSPLFAADQFTQIEWKVRQALDGHQLAQWLHGFYASHAKPFPVKIETLHRLCGSEQEMMSDYAKKLRKALEALSEASLAYGEGFSYEILDNLVYVEKTLNKGQHQPAVKKVEEGSL